MIQMLLLQDNSKNVSELNKSMYESKSEFLEQH